MADRVVDPVCGMMVDPDRAAGHVEHLGTTYHFCSKGCAAKFTADPDKYLSGAREPMRPVVQIGGLKRSSSQIPAAASPQSPAPSPQSPTTLYTCPMHPEVVSDEPGACPKCGMALEPMITDVSADADAPNPELADMTRRFWIGVVLGAP